VFGVFVVFAPTAVAIGYAPARYNWSIRQEDTVMWKAKRETAEEQPARVVLVALDESGTQWVYVNPCVSSADWSVPASATLMLADMPCNRHERGNHGSTMPISSCNPQAATRTPHRI
jgi:hypothetical protein